MGKVKPNTIVKSVKFDNLVLARLHFHNGCEFKAGTNLAELELNDAAMKFIVEHNSIKVER